MTEMSLSEASNAFADGLNQVLESVVDSTTRFRVVVASSGLSANLEATDYPASRYDGVPLVRPNDDPAVL